MRPLLGIAIRSVVRSACRLSTGAARTTQHAQRRKQNMPPLSAPPGLEGLATALHDATTWLRAKLGGRRTNIRKLPA